LDTVLQVGSHKRGVEGENYLPRPTGHTSLDACHGPLDSSPTPAALGELTKHHALQESRTTMQLYEGSLRLLTNLSAMSFQVVVETDEVSPQLSLPQTEQSQLLQSLLIGFVLQALHQLRCPPLHSLQHLDISLVLRCPKLDTILQ
ncbi:unnamed protein product, partial [Bubo scandiacus]